MERNLERKTLSFSKGMTNVPSDLLSDDSELLESDGFIFKDGEMKAVQKGVEIGNVPYKIMYVHKMADYENIIAYDEFTDGGTLAIYEKGKLNKAAFTYTHIGAVYDVSSVGNTLVVATDSGLRYFLHKGEKYEDLGMDIPEPHFNPWFGIRNEIFSKNTYEDIQPFLEDKGNVSYTLNEDGTISVENGGDYNYHLFELPPNGEKFDNAQNRIKGCVSKATNIVKENNFFPHPFFIRFAWKLVDGSYTKISNPIICYPTVRRNGNFCTNNASAFHPTAYPILFQPCYGELYFDALNNHIDEWKDIIKELVVFASDDVAPYKADEDWKIVRPESLNGQRRYDGVANGKYLDVAYKFATDTSSSNNNLDTLVTQIQFVPTKYKTDDEIIDELIKKTQYYKLFSLKVGSLQMNGDTVKASTVMKDHTVENLTSQEQLAVDDYYGWTKKVGKKIYPYNNRINLIGVKRYPFKGFTIFKAGYISPTTAYGFVKYYVHIVSQTMDTWVLSNALLIDKDYQPYNDWYFYPDPNAREMIIMVNKYQEGKTYYYNINLQMHPMLNGSYSFADLPPTLLATGKDVENKTTGGFEDLNSQIFTSVVNNPFVFEASGDNTVGTGKILGIIANTEAVSQGQFGQYPLMVFTDEGIYGLSVNSEGLYSRAYPISREVCNEDSPLVPTDRLVFFAAKKGLMAASGGSVACMSEQMRGRVPRNFATFGEGKFLDFLKGCLIAYDYRDSILRIFSKGKSYQYIYNMVDKTFSMVNSGIEAQAVVNDYPDNLIQDTNGNVYSLTAKPDINEDTENYSGSFTTRPLKLGGSMTLKSLRAVKHLFDSDEGTIGLEIYGSNDCKHWCKLPSLAGKPWKYFTFKYTLQNFKAADAFAGSIVEVQSRREDKMR